MSRVLNKDAVITRAFNNNLALVKVDGKEKIIFAKGIGFGKKFGEIISKDTFVEKIFSIEDESNAKNLKRIVEKVDNEFFTVCEEAIVDISKKVEGELNEKIHVSLIDHLHFAVKRLKNKEEIVNPFLAEIESFYPKEYELAKIVANRVGKAMNIAIPEGEVGFIALHVHSALNNGKLSNTVKYSYLSGNIIKHIEERLHLTIDRKSLDYTRFITHIRFAIERIMNKAKIHNDLSDVIKIRYKESYKVAKEVALIIQDYLAVKVSEEEIAYLALHIERFRVSLSD